VNVIAYRTVRAFTDTHPAAEALMRDWYNALCKTDPQNFAELRADFPSVDLAHQRDGTTLFIFDVGGNRYRIVTRLDFEFKVGFILYVFNHADYTKWNKGGRS
jgi:mRNA interferase HigB